MYSYTVDGSVVTIVVTGATTPEDRESVLGAIRLDPRVPIGALLLIDATHADVVGNVAALQERAHLFVQMLGPKMGPLCALVAHPALVPDAALFQVASGEMGVRVALFGDKPSAMDWLAAYRKRDRAGASS